MHILLTGWAGLLGSDIEECLQSRGHRITRFNHRLESKNFEKKYPAPYDWVIHAAAMTNVNGCEDDPERAWTVNALGTRKMRDIAAKAGARFMYISTASVFSGEKGNYAESATPYPQNFYNHSKFGGELFASEYPKSSIVRLVGIGVHKNGSRGKNFLEWLVDSYIQNRDIFLFKDVFINPLSTITLAEQIEKVVRSRKQLPIIHLTSRDRLSKAAIGQLIQKRFPQYHGNIEVTTSELHREKNHPKQMWLNGDTTAKAFGIDRPSIREEVDRVLSMRVFKS